MGTSIHALMPQEDASSPASLATCAGSAHFAYVQEFYKGSLLFV